MSSLVCKKCKGNHLTIKCGKQKNKVDNSKTNGYNKKDNNRNDRNDRNNRNNRNNRNDRNNRNNKKTCVKISNLPQDITPKELNNLIQPWGYIGNINFGKSYNIVAYIDFFKKTEAEYFVKALDRTPFDNVIINVEIKL